jgi:hypothetical protein
MNMKNILFALLLLPQILFAQKHDYVWVTGDDNSLTDTTRGGSTIDFNFTPPKVYYNYREQNMFVCNSSICDTAGNLMFYTNGCDIAGADDTILENGETINPGYVHQLKCDQENDGYTAGYQSTIILPVPDSNNLYYLFHKRIIFTSNPFDVKTDKLFYSIIDMNANSGKGKVIEKNTELMSDYLAFGEMTAVKHANGKDWWLVTPKDHSNTFYIFLFTKDGIVDTLEQTIGTAPPTNASGGIQMVFSPDGAKMFRTNPQKAIKVYDFNRSTGSFTAYDTIHVDYKNYPDPVTTWCAVSPNSRYLYITTSLYVFQFDLWASDISTSQQIVAEWDGFQDPIGTTFGACQLGPDCKIYIVTIDSKYYHVINSPDEPGLSSNVTQHSFILPKPSGASMPFFPNYRLGPVDNPGVPCTATVGTQAPPTPLPVFSVFPNPVSAALKIVPNRQFGGQARVRLFDVTGRMALEEIFDPQSACTELDVRALPDGMYFYEIWSEGRVARAGKVFKVE